MKLLIWALALLLVSMDAAHAGPVGAALAAVSTAVKGSALLTGLVQLGASVVLSKISQRLAERRQSVSQPGREIEGLTTGENAGETFVVGNWATGGHMTYQGSFGNHEEFLVRVIELAGIPRHDLRSVIIRGTFVDLVGVPSEVGPLNDRVFTGSGSIATGDATGGATAVNPALSRDGQPLFYLRYHDGTQTSADAFLREIFGNHPQRPYGADMVGAGIPYAVVTFRQDNDTWSSGVEPVFVLRGVPLYDPRLDSTVGGSGPHRWGQPETYTTSANPLVIAYNAAVGVHLPGGDVWGGGYSAADLPLARWVAAMNYCDARGYEFGAEVNVVETEPASLIEACFAAAGGQIAAVGGALIPQVGPPDVPVWSVSNDDLSAEDGVIFDPIQGLAERINAVQGSYLAPGQLWQPRALPLFTQPAWQAEDGGRRLPADLPLAGVYKGAQAQELVEAYARDGRRQRTHTLTIAPDAARLSLFDTITLTRPEDGYISKLVEVVGFEQRIDDTFCVVSLREVDPDDYNPTAPVLPEPPQAAPLPVFVQEVPGFTVAPAQIIDSDSVARRAGALLTWDFSQFDDVRALSIEIRLAGTVDPTLALQIAAETGRHLQELLPATAYEVRARLAADRRTEWTSWRPVLTPDVRLTQADMADSLREEFDAARELLDGTVENIGGVVGDLRDRIGEILAPIVGPGLPSVPHIARIDGALIEEAQARAADVQALAGGIAAEAGERTSDVLALASGIRDVRDRIQRTANEVLDVAAFDHLAREEIRASLTVQVEGARADYTQQITVLAGEQTAIAQQVVTLGALTDNLGASITAVDTARVEGQNALAAQIALLSVGSAVQFDQVAIWYWDTTVEGWTGDPDAPTVMADGFLVPAAGSFIISPSGLEVNTQAFRQVRARLRNEPDTWADAWLYWAAEGEGWDAARRVEIAAPEWANDEAQLTVNPDWAGVVDRVRLDLPDGVEIDWLAIGRPAPGASSADIAAERAARIAQGLALAEDITTLTADLNAAEGLISGNADAIDAVTVRVEETEEGISTLSEAQTALFGQVGDLETGLEATGEAVDLLTVRTETLEDGTSVQSESVRAVGATLKLVANEALEGIAASLLRDQDALEIIAEASQTLNTRIDLTNDQITIVAEAVTLLQAAIPGLATAQALQVLTSRVDVTESEITALSQAITSLQAEIPDLASASAVQALETRVTSTESVNSTQASQITALEAGLSDAEDGIEAGAEALSNLTATVTQQGDEIESVSGDVTALTNRVTTAEGQITGQAGALQTLTSRVTAAEGVNTAQSQAITDLESGLTNAQSGVNANSSAISGLTTRTTDAEGVLTSQGQQITTLESGLSTTNTNVTAAQQAAQNAANLAGSKGRVFFQNSAPPTDQRLPQNLWIDTTGGANTPKRWNGSAWVAVTDKVATDAAAAAAAAQALAQTKADASAVQALETTVTQQGNTLTAQGQQITNLQADLLDVESDVSANAGAVSNLQSTVTQQGNTLTAQGTSITNLQSGLNSAQADISGNASAIGTLITQVEEVEGEVESIAASTRVLEVSNRSANLVPNGAFQTGDFTGWGAVPGTFSVIARGSSGAQAVQNAPTAHILSANQSGSNQGARAVSGLAVKPGDVFRASFEIAAGLTSPSATWRVNLVWLDAEGEALSITSLTSTVTTGIWQSVVFDPATAPAGAATLDVNLLRLGGGSGTGYLTNLRLERDSAANVSLGARIDTIETVKVDAAGAVAAVNQQISVEYGSLTALAEATAFAEANANGTLSGFIFALQGQDVITALAVQPNGTVDPNVVLRLSGNQIILDGNTQVTGSFLLDGQAHIASASIGTLQIAERSVTVPVHVQLYAVNVLSSASDWVTIGFVTIARTAGVPVQVQFGGQLDGILPALGQGLGAVAQFEVWRGNTLVQGNMAQVSGYLGARTSFEFMAQDTGGSGTVTYTVRARRLSSPPHDRTTRVFNVFVRATEYKR